MAFQILLTILAVAVLVGGCTTPPNTPTPTLQPTTTILLPTLRPTATVLLPTLNLTLIPETPTPTLTFTPIPDTATPALTLTPTTTLGIGSSMISEKDGMTMVFVPAGPFLMGSKQGDSGAQVSEQPQRTVTLDAFWIDQTEVTNARYALCVADGACQPPSEMGSGKRGAYYNDAQYAGFPVIYVSWDDADSYCRWAGRRLPSEAEWEKAARGENGQFYPWGDQGPTCDLANFSGCVGDTTAAGSYPGGASPYGALDMTGNVWEWVADLYAGDYYKTGPTDNPPGPSSGMWRVLRGGALLDGARNVRVAYRGGSDPVIRYGYVGFRCSR